MTRYFVQGVNFIKDALETTSIMVHCLAGVSRSVCLVLAYFIKCRGFSYDEAYNLVKLKRSIVILHLLRSIQMKDLFPNSGNTRIKSGAVPALPDMKLRLPQRKDMNITTKSSKLLAIIRNPINASSCIYPLRREQQYNHVMSQFTNPLSREVSIPLLAKGSNLRLRIFTAHLQKEESPTSSSQGTSLSLSHPLPFNSEDLILTNKKVSSKLTSNWGTSARSAEELLSLSQEEDRIQF